MDLCGFGLRGLEGLQELGRSWIIARRSNRTTGCADGLLRRQLLRSGQLVDHMRVGGERHRRRMAGLAGDVETEAALG